MSMDKVTNRKHMPSPAAQRAADDAKKPIKKDGRPNLQETGTMEKPATFVGTPRWIKNAANRAEDLSRSIVRSFANGGIQEAARHRIPDTHWSAGAPDYAKRSQQKHHMKNAGRGKRSGNRAWEREKHETC